MLVFCSTQPHRPAKGVRWVQWAGTGADLPESLASAHNRLKSLETNPNAVRGSFAAGKLDVAARNDVCPDVQ